MNETATSSELRAFYEDRRLLRRNVCLILIMLMGWSAAFNVLNPLIQLRLNKAGLAEGNLGLLNTVNSWAYSYVVMYFAWRSDHTVSRFGRRMPYLFLSAPIIIVSVFLFPFVHLTWLLVVLDLLILLFMDIKAATIPLLNIDCVPRHMLARIGALGAVICGSVNFLAVRYGMRLADHWEAGPYLCAGVLLILTTVAGGLLIREPPVKDPTTERFKPWSAMKVAWQDKRAIILMLGVAMIMTFVAVYNQWVWLYAKKELGLSRTDIGAAVSWSILLPVVISFPVGWVIDRFGSYRVVVVYWLLTCLAAWWIITQVHDASSLAIAALLLAGVGPLYQAADILVYRDADPRHVGSVTSTNSCLRGVMIGISILFSGFLIERSGGNYKLAFLYGAIISTAGFVLLMTYGWLLRQKRVSSTLETAGAVPLPAVNDTVMAEVVP